MSLCDRKNALTMNDPTSMSNLLTGIPALSITTYSSSRVIVLAMSLLHLSPKASALKEKLEEFVNECCIPAEEEYERHVAQFSGADRWTLTAVPPVLSRLKAEAQSLGVWNLFLPHPIPSHLIQGGTNNNDITITPSMYLSNREYGILCEVMGRSTLAPEACNCSAPDTGNMEVLLKHGTKNQQAIQTPVAGEIKECVSNDGTRCGIQRCEELANQIDKNRG